MDLEDDDKSVNSTTELSDSTEPSLDYHVKDTHIF